MVAPSSVAELYANAMAMEGEAAERYAEFAQRMEDEGHEDLARVFAMLAAHEAGHLETLERRTRGVPLPPVTECYGWLDAGAPETAARELVYRLLTPRQALAIALRAERRAYAWFAHLAITAADPGVRALAREMAAEELGHAVLIADLLEGRPAPRPDTVPFEQARKPCTSTS